MNGETISQKEEMTRIICHKNVLEKDSLKRENMNNAEH